MMRSIIQRIARGRGVAPVYSYQGLTLLELLVAIAILGILSAVAAPTFLSYSTRARQTEAQTNVGSMLRAQQAYYTWGNSFTDDLAALEIGISNSRYYEYRTHVFTNHFNVNGDRVNGAIAIAVPLADVRGYMGKVWTDDASGVLELRSVMCEGEIRDAYFMNSRTYCP